MPRGGTLTTPPISSQTNTFPMLELAWTGRFSSQVLVMALFLRGPPDTKELVEFGIRLHLFSLISTYIERMPYEFDRPLAPPDRL